MECKNNNKDSKIMDITNKLNNFEKRSWAIKIYSAKYWGNNIPCPLRLVINTYNSCEYNCPYCYVWYHKGKPKIRRGFRKSLIHDIERGGKYEISKFVIEISTSTDPFQPIEEIKEESLFTIKKLLANGFKVLIVTKNPSLFLTNKYNKLLKEKNLFIDVTITSLKEGSLDGNILNNNGPSASEKINAIKEIIALGKNVRVRIDPVIPSIDNISGQSAEDLKDLTRMLSDIGVKLIISKTMRLNQGMSKPFVDKFYNYYKKNGVLIESNYILSNKIRRKLLWPIYKECQNQKIDFCPCCDSDVFPSEVVSTCSVDGETKILNREVILENQFCTGGRDD